MLSLVADIIQLQYSCIWMTCIEVSWIKEATHLLPSASAQFIPIESRSDVTLRPSSLKAVADLCPPPIWSAVIHIQPYERAPHLSHWSSCVYLRKVYHAKTCLKQ